MPLMARDSWRIACWAETLGAEKASDRMTRSRATFFRFCPSGHISLVFSLARH